MSNNRRIFTRRSVLSLAIAGAAASLPRLSAAVGKRSVVVIHLFGGNDANNMIVPLDESGYAAYARTRGELALPANSLLPVKTLRGDRTFGFHPSFSEVQRIYAQGQLAVIANVGAAVRPDAGDTQALSFVKGGFAMPRWAEAGGVLDESAFGFEDTGVAVLPLEGGAARDPEWRKTNAGAKTPPLRTEFPDSALARSLRHIAGMLQNQPGSAVYFTSLGGFDTTFGQLDRHSALLATLSQAMGAFHQATLEMGVANRVTTVTDSEIGRSLYPNRNHGSSAGWGTHHLVMGASAQGGHIHGEFPDLSAGAALDANGALIPTTARDRFEATLHGWLHSRVRPASLEFLA